MSQHIYCSFCGKSAESVERIFAAPTVFICDECVDKASAMLAADRAGEASDIVEAPISVADVPAKANRGPLSQIYFIYCKATKAIKIGIGRTAKARLSNLQIGCAEKLVLLGWLLGTEATEKDIHHNFHADRLSGEWFKDTPELRAYIAKATAK